MLARAHLTVYVVVARSTLSTSGRICDPTVGRFNYRVPSESALRARAGTPSPNQKPTPNPNPRFDTEPQFTERRCSWPTSLQAENIRSADHSCKTRVLRYANFRDYSQRSGQHLD